MINWLLQQIEEYQTWLTSLYLPRDVEQIYYCRGKIEAYKECLEYIEKASRKEKIYE